jgi:hypothetical protein
MVPEDLERCLLELVLLLVLPLVLLLVLVLDLLVERMLRHQLLLRLRRVAPVVLLPSGQP